MQCKGVAQSDVVVTCMGRPVLPELISRPVPLMMPLVKVWSRPNGLPIANTF